MIPEKQNAQINIDRLSAQRNLYTQAKQLHLLRMVLTIPCVLLLSLLVAFLPIASWLFAAFSISVFALDQIFLRSQLQTKKGIGALIQEEFDCDVLELPWNSIMNPSRCQREDCIHYSTQYKKNKKNKIDSLGDWYESINYDAIPQNARRLICQRSNVTWDAALRRRYNNLMYIAGGVGVIVLIIAACIYDLEFRSFIIITAAGVAPIAGFIVGEMKDNNEAISKLDKAKHVIESLWEGILTRTIDDTKQLETSRQLQDLIFGMRKMNPLIPDWIYWKHRPEQVSLMNQIVEQMSNEYLARQ